MNTIIKFISDNDIMIMTALLILIILLTIFVLIIDIINRKKNAKDADIIFNNSESNVINAFKENMVEEQPLEYTTDLSQFENAVKLPVEQQIKYVEEDEELEKTKAQLELKNLKEELIKADQKEREERIKAKENAANNINAVNAEEVKKEESHIDKIDSFEASQEENAIISIDQFNKVSDKIYEQNEEVQYKDEGNEPISIKELEELYNTKELKVIPTDEEIIDVINVKKEEPIVKEEIEKKFKSSPVISPVFGTIDEDKVSTIALENTANLDKLSEEIRRTNEFLNLLRELRKNLE